MAASLRFAALLLVVLSLSACRGCDDRSAQVAPSLSVTPVAVSFGTVKVGQSLALPVKLNADSRASVNLGAMRLVDVEPPGAAAAFAIIDAPEVVPQLGSETFRLAFTPTALQIYAAQLIIPSNDPERPEIKVTVSGEGATPKLVATPICETAADCQGSASLMPPSLDFGAEPLQRLNPHPVTKLPLVALVNEGAVELAITHLAIEGADAAAFTIQGNTALEDTLPDGTPALLLDGGEGLSVSIRFVPTKPQQESYAAELVVRSDDLLTPEVRIPLTGRRADNLPPTVCANIIRVTNGDGSPPFSYDSSMYWAPLIPPPMSGIYDFTQTRDVQPSSRATMVNPGNGPTEVRFSALSDPTDNSVCTFDPEDGRAGLTYLWEILEQPDGAGATQFGAGAEDDPTTSLFLSLASGSYRVRLTVTDALGASSSVELVFDAVIKEDLVVQLSWNGGMRAYEDVDLDLHLVRPSSTDGGTFSGVFSFFEEAPTGMTSGDINGVARLPAYFTAGRNFEWGDAGTSDDPRLNLDDFGTGPLVENISLNYPERDPRCATQRCDYQVLVHYFADARSHSGNANCEVTGAPGCRDGEACACPTGQRCVETSSMMNGDVCYRAPEFVVRIFVRGDPTPLREIPLDTDGLTLGAVCQMMHVAAIAWPSQAEIAAGLPDGGLPLPDVTLQAHPTTFFGARSGLRCQPNSNGWYVEN